jgi:hypothetical protein
MAARRVTGSRAAERVTRNEHVESLRDALPARLKAVQSTYRG